MSVLVILYSIFFPFLTGAARLAALGSPKIRTYFTLRKNLIAQIEQKLSSHQCPSLSVWVHAASVGEFEQARPVIERLKQQDPACSIVISFQSPSGYNIRKDYPQADAVFYHPVDSPGNARKLVKLVKPDIVMIMRYDFWINHLLAARKYGAKLILVGAVLQDHSIYFKPLANRFYRQVFQLFDQICTVTENDRQKFARTFGINKALTAGDPRFDQVWNRSRNRKEQHKLKSLYRGKTVLVAGSTWEKDEEILLTAYLQAHDNLSLIIVPHETDANNIHRIETDLLSHAIDYHLLTKLPEDFSPASVLVVDAIGFLVELYALADIAYVGGGFGINVHNTLEPAVYAIPVLFGPNHHNSPEAEALIALKGATEIRNESELEQAIRHLLSDTEQRKNQGEIAGRYVRERLGATEIITRMIMELTRES